MTNVHVGKNLALVTSASWPEEELENVGRCPVCESAGRSILYSGLADVTFSAAPGEWTMWKCGACTSLYLDPRPDRENIGKAYQIYYTHDASNVGAGLGKPGLLGRARQKILNGFVNRRFGTRLSPAWRAGFWMTQLRPSWSNLCGEYFRNIPIRSGTGRILDIGCGNGDYLARMVDMGWHGFGLETDLVAAEAARSRGLTVQIGGIEQFAGKAEQFNFISMGHVIEHLHDPVGMIQDCFRLLKPGGYLWIETPNANAFGHDHFGRHWRGLEVPRHLVIFARDALIDALSKCGFREIADCRRNNPFKGLASTSGILAKGQRLTDGQGAGSVTLQLRLKSALKNLSPNKREFVTIIGRKC